MKSVIALAVAALITVASAQLQPGQLYQPTPPEILVEESQTLERFPDTFGAWKMIEQGPDLSQNVQEELGLVEYISRVYRNSQTGEEAGLLLMFGHPGPLVRHPPDICYANRGSRSLDTAAIEIKTDEQSHHFRSLAYLDQAALDRQSEFVVAYAHAADLEWNVPEYPRFVYGSQPYLYKMQVLVTEGKDINGRVETARTFLTEFVKAFAMSKQTKS